MYESMNQFANWQIVDLTDLNFITTNIGCEDEAGVCDRIGSEWTPLTVNEENIVPGGNI